ncbi:hypothetical protein [Paenibacillus taichungensis]|uniref:hypothetical protein n=1 Tax=Paenibacillus taichungensis TaxID=484184 RepID=UPI003D9A9340
MLKFTWIQFDQLDLDLLTKSFELPTNCHVQYRAHDKDKPMRPAELRRHVQDFHLLFP